MMLNFRVPPSAVAFRLVFEEFCRAYPLGVDRVRRGPFPNDDTRKAVEHLATELERSHPARMLHLLQERLQTVDRARIILVREERDSIEVSPEILDGIEQEAARYGICAFQSTAVERIPIARD